MVNIIKQGKIDKEHCHTVATVQAVLKLSNRVTKRTNAPRTWDDSMYSINIMPDYAASRIKYVNMPEQFQEMWDTQLRQIDVVNYWLNISSPESRSLQDVPYHTGSKGRGAQKVEIDKSVAKILFESAQTKCASPLVFVSKKEVMLSCFPRLLQARSTNHQRYAPISTDGWLHRFFWRCMDILYIWRE